MTKTIKKSEGNQGMVLEVRDAPSYPSRDGMYFFPTVASALAETRRRLTEAGISNEAGESREIVAAAVGTTGTFLPLKIRDVLTPSQKSRLESLTEERCRRIPLAYVLKEWDFGNLRLEITPDVLIPRPETEELFEKLRDRLNSAGAAAGFTAADVGTGSGCLSIALAKTFLNSTVYSLDISPKALQVARRNALRHGVSGRIHFMEGDLLEPILRSGENRLDVIVANLPYVDETDMAGLDPEVQKEPSLALDGGRGGLDVIFKMIPQAFRALKSGGVLYLEVGHRQAVSVGEALVRAGFGNVRLQKDFAMIQRFVSAEKI